MSLSGNQIILIAAIVAGVVFIKIFVLPRLLRAMLGVKKGVGVSHTWRERVELRYEKMHTSVWMFVWFKVRLDPMFGELPAFVKEMGGIRLLLDLGCGYGVAGCALLEQLPELRVYAIDPNARRVRIASRAFGERGRVVRGGAPNFELPELPGRFDGVMVLDVLHYLRDEELVLTLRRIYLRLGEGGRLIIRVPVPPKGRGSFTWHLSRMSNWITGGFASYREPERMAGFITEAGFRIDRAEMSGTANRELFWFIGTK